MLRRYILPQLQTKELEILKYDGKDVHILPVVVLANVNAIQQNLTRRRIVQPAKQFDESRFSASVHAHDRQPFTDFKVQGKQHYSAYLQKQPQDLTCHRKPS